ncbi:MAG: phosphohydrolase, partial [Candidatus Bipolaricaulota bacterium]
MKFTVPTRSNTKLKKAIKSIQDNGRLNGIWTVANVNAVDRMGINDHGPVHSKIVANSALRMSRLITGSGATPSIVKAHGMTEHDAEVVIVLASV